MPATTEAWVAVLNELTVPRLTAPPLGLRSEVHPALVKVVEKAVTKCGDERIVHDTAIDDRGLS